jgi:nucleotide-binding universal stress UspA family protein
MLHVRQGSELFRSSSEGVHEALSVTRNRLKAFGADELAGVSVKQLVLPGYPSTTIAEFADRQHCDLVVMPTHGYGPVRRFLLGSVTAQVLERARCPVWTIASSTGEANCSALKQVLCGVELTPAAANVIRWAASFADAFNASLCVLSVLPATPPEDVPEWYVPEWDEGALPGLESRLRGLVQELGVHADILVDKGDSATILLDVTRSQKADLLVIGRTTRESDRGELGGNTYAIVRHARCPVVSV